MPNGVVRVYPASGTVVMLPLTPANNYIPALLFCGGSDVPEAYYGNYSWPYYNTWTYLASMDCQHLMPKPQDDSLPAYKQDDDMLVGRMMGQSVTLPNGTMFILKVPQTGLLGSPTRRSMSLGSTRCPFSSRSHQVLSAPPPFTTPMRPRARTGPAQGRDQYCENVPLDCAPFTQCIRVDRWVEPQHRCRARRALSDDLHHQDLLPALLFIERLPASDGCPADTQL
jgi:hypothetical protein